MAGRVASPYWFRAEGAVLPWQQMLERRLRQEPFGEIGAELEKRLAQWQRAVAERPVETHLRWSCSQGLGVPFEPFTVWIRDAKDRAHEVDVRVSPTEAGLVLRWGFVAAIVEVDCDIIDPTRAVGLFLTRGGGSLLETVGATAIRAPGGGRVTLRVRTSGATRAVLVNGSDPSARCEPLHDVLDDEAWQEFERVGLPADDPWSETAYRASDQGMVSSLTDPVSAALERLQRGGPPIGWWPVTESGRIAPPWQPPDHSLLLDEVLKELFPQIEPIFAPGVLPPDQAAIVASPPVDRPQRAGNTSTLAARADLSPLSLLQLPAASEPFLALATGFGTAYPFEGDFRGDVAISRFDFMVTGEYEETPRRAGPASVAAFIPAPEAHRATPSPTRLTAERAGLVAPDIPDDPWRESVRVSWDRMPSAAALGRPSGAMIGRFDPAGTSEAEPLVEKRAAGDFRPLVPVPDGPKGTPGFSRTAMVDAAAVIPLGSGGRSCGYAVAVEDVFGVWSRWEDVLYSGTEPGPPLPRIIRLALDTRYDGFTSCPATLEVEVSVDWADRTPTDLDVAAVFFPMATAASAPPPGVDPDASPPLGSFRVDTSLTFDTTTGELLPPSGVGVDHLDTAGEAIVDPGPLQGEHGRRYRLRIKGITLDFAATARWGVQVWARTTLLALGGPMAWSPDPAHPALASAGSPVPVEPLPPPQPPGVPLGSAPDAEGRSHARVHWSLPTGANVEKVVVWEVAETALRQAAGLPPRAPEGRLPGWRLQDLRDAYDALPTARRRSVFRRVQELSGTVRETDVELAKGSTDIHLFAVTTVTSTGVDSPWPSGSPPHQALQAVMGPRLRRPSTPRVRSVVASDGTVTLELTAMSRVPVHSFRLFRSRSPVAARSAETMGPAFATVLATASDAPPDPATRELLYKATWSGPFDPSWDEWFIRVVAVPVDVVPPEGVRGLLSPACEPVSVTVLPTAPPDLAPLTGDIWGAANDGVVVRTSTSAPVRAVALGSHRLSGTAHGTDLPIVALEDVREDTAEPPSDAAPGPVLVRGPRAAGRTPLTVWFTRPVASDPADVVLRIVDPLGRVTERSITVPGFVPTAPPLPTLELIDVFRILGRGVVLTLRSDAPVDADPPYRLEIVAMPERRGRRIPLIGVLIPPARDHVHVSFPLDEIPTRTAPFGRQATVQVVRTNTASPFEYSALIRIPHPFELRIAIVAPDNRRVEVSTEVR